MSVKTTSELSSASLAILGGGNLGQALARGLVRSGTLRPEQIHVTSLHLLGLEGLAAEKAARLIADSEIGRIGGLCAELSAAADRPRCTDLFR